MKADTVQKIVWIAISLFSVAMLTLTTLWISDVLIVGYAQTWSSNQDEIGLLQKLTDAILCLSKIKIFVNTMEYIAGFLISAIILLSIFPYIIKKMLKANLGKKTNEK